MCTTSVLPTKTKYWQKVLFTRESDPRSYEATKAVAMKAQRKFWSFNGIWTHHLRDTGVMLYQLTARIISLIFSIRSAYIWPTRWPIQATLEELLQEQSIHFHFSLLFSFNPSPPSPPPTHPPVSKCYSSWEDGAFFKIVVGNVDFCIALFTYLHSEFLPRLLTCYFDILNSV